RAEARVGHAEHHRVPHAGRDPAQRPRRWYATPALPRTPTGKPARAALASRLADGGLEPLA
ncbi:MAG: hypothetical protein DIU60_016605, partial [Actinomycetes bacterium]